MSNTPTDCCADPGQKLLSVEQGRKRILAAVSAIEATEQLPLRAALGRILCEPVVARIDVPPFANSAMDGYAVRSEDCPDSGAVTLEIIGSAFAGAPFAERVGAGQCVRIMTGAVLPDGADAVLMQEHVSREQGQIRCEHRAVQQGQNVRYAGEDTRRGDTVLPAGRRLGAAELGLLASVGVAEVCVTRKLRVAFFSTGDELASAGTPLVRGQIYDSNRYALFGMLSRPEIECYDLGVIPDRREAVRTAFREAAAMADMVLTTGGVSVGEADYVTETLGELGEISFWRMAMKPGKPLAFGHVGNEVFFGLPGNPVSSYITFELFVRPALRRLRGEDPDGGRPHVRATLTEAVRKSAGRRAFIRVRLEEDAAHPGAWRAHLAGSQGSHVLSALALADGLAVIPEDMPGAEAGTEVEVIRLDVEVA